MQRPFKDAVPHGLLSLISYRTQNHLPRDSTTHNGLGPPHQSLGKCLQVCLQSNLVKTFSQLGYLLSMILAGVKLT